MKQGVSMSIDAAWLRASRSACPENLTVTHIVTA
jgi:hypothetical protein